MAGSLAPRVWRATRELARAVDAFSFAAPVTHVYNPLDYARASHKAYVERFGAGKKRVLFLGMNPGPFGMAQTGIPFGEVESVRDWMGISARIRRPKVEHPKRPVDGFDCARSEVSGARLWGAIAGHWGTPEDFFSEHYVLNYCPLLFVEESGRNRTPDKLPAAEKDPLFEVCDRHLRRMVDLFEPQWLIGVGAFARDRARRVLGDDGPRIETVLHPSPASPLANRGWKEAAEKQLRALGICADA